MRTGKDRVEVESMQAPISLGEIQVRPGDILVGDADGITLWERASATLPKKRRIEIDVAAATTETITTEPSVKRHQ